MCHSSWGIDQRIIEVVLAGFKHSHCDVWVLGQSSDDGEPYGAATHDHEIIGMREEVFSRRTESWEGVI